MRHCSHFRDVPLTRREMLQTCSGGFGAFALACLLADKGYSAPDASGTRVSLGTHHTPKAKNVTRTRTCAKNHRACAVPGSAAWVRPSWA